MEDRRQQIKLSIVDVFLSENDTKVFFTPFLIQNAHFVGSYE